MFTGIVEELGEVVATEPDPVTSITRLTVRGPLVSSDAAEGDSIAVNGVCLTVTGVAGDTFTVDAVAETLHRTSVGGATRVNLERAVTPATRLGGHLVQGHVDGVGTLLERGEDGVIRVGMPPELTRYLVPKGSITVDGISLTVVEAGDDSFTVALIPTTLARTTLGRAPIGGPVNLEVDVVAKYVERLLGARAGSVEA
jgi:riboflavin synthase